MSRRYQGVKSILPKILQMQAEGKIHREIQEYFQLPPRGYHCHAASFFYHANGFEKAKIETIADNAGVAKGSIYQYFEDKKELFLYSVTWSMEYFMKEIDKYTPLKEMDIFDYLLKDGRSVSNW